MLSIAWICTYSQIPNHLAHKFDLPQRPGKPDTVLSHSTTPSKFSCTLLITFIAKDSHVKQEIQLVKRFTDTRRRILIFYPSSIFQESLLLICLICQFYISRIWWAMSESLTNVSHSTTKENALKMIITSSMNGTSLISPLCTPPNMTNKRICSSTSYQIAIMQLSSSSSWDLQVNMNLHLRHHGGSHSLSLHYLVNCLTNYFNSWAITSGYGKTRLLHWYF